MTFGYGGLDFGAFEDDAMVVDVLLLVDEVIVIPVLPVVRGSGGVAGGKLHLGDEEPLDKREDDAHDGTHGDEDLGAEIRKYRRRHGTVVGGR